MKRASKLGTLFAIAFLVASPLATAQDTPEATPSPTPESGGEITVGVQGHESINSSKFQEYREVPTGVFVPYFNLFSSGGKVDFNLYGYNVHQDDQRYLGSFDTSSFGLSFDYNQVPHNMGNDGRSIYAESSPGVWSLSSTLQQSLQTAVDTRLPTSTRNTAFYDQLLAPTLGSTHSIDVSSLRKRGTYELDLGKKLPVTLALTYLHELKSGYRGFSGGNIRGTVNPSYEVPEPLDELTQDIGLRFAYGFKSGEVYANFNRSLYDNRVETMTIYNPFQATHALVTPASGAIPILGGPAFDHVVNAPDNEASTGKVGFQLKFAKQTRIGGAVSLATWTQNAPFYAYTSNTAVRTPNGTPASSLAALPQSSYDGKFERTTWNLTFSSRPATGLGLRAQYRAYDLTDKSAKWVSTGDMSTPHANWNVATPTADAPYGRLTANPYDTTSGRFDASVSYDIGDLTLEGAFHHTELTRTYREATSGTDKGYLLAVLYRSRDWLNLRAKYQDTNRTAEGHTVYGFQADEAERDMTRTSFEVELMPSSNTALSFAYQRRDVEFPNRPDRVQVSGGVPVAGAQPIPGTPSGLLEASYDSFTVEASFNPNERTELSAFYTYEKDAATNQWSTTTGANLNNLLNFAGSSKADTFGANARFQLVPEKCTLTLNASHQKVDGLNDITAREAGSFYTPGRTGLIPAGQGGAADMNNWDDTELTTVALNFDYLLAKAWTLSAGYWYEKYDFKDAFTSGDLLMPQAVYIFMKADSGAYTANVVYARLNYRF